MSFFKDLICAYLVMSQLSVLDGKFDWSITLEEWRHEYSTEERGEREGKRKESLIELTMSTAFFIWGKICY